LFSCFQVDHKLELGRLLFGCCAEATSPQAAGDTTIARSPATRFIPPLILISPPSRTNCELRLTGSAAKFGRRSSFPSAYRDSMTMFFPSTYPSSRSRWRNASMRADTAEAGTATIIVTLSARLYPAAAVGRER
jgi:hypothetical protein